MPHPRPSSLLHPAQRKRPDQDGQEYGTLFSIPSWYQPHTQDRIWCLVVVIDAWDSCAGCNMGCCCTYSVLSANLSCHDSTAVVTEAILQRHPASPIPAHTSNGGRETTRCRYCMGSVHLHARDSWHTGVQGHEPVELAAGVSQRANGRSNCQGLTSQGNSAWT